jgi:hypothetical protein
MKFGPIEIPPKEEVKKLKSTEEWKKEEASSDVPMDQDFYERFKILENMKTYEKEDNTEYLNRINKEYEIKNKDDFYKYINQFEDDQFVSPSNFKRIVDFIFKDDELFNKFEDKLSYLLRTSIDEEFMIEDFSSEDLTEEQEDKEWEKVDQTIDSYIEKIFSFYDQGNFEEKLRVINFLKTQAALTLFNNNGNTISRIKYFLNNRLEKEKELSGNHYICLHLESLLDGTEDNFYPQILPNQFIAKEYIDKIENGVMYLGEGSVKLLISNVEDFDQLKLLLQKRIDLVEKFRRMKYSYPEYENLGEQISLTIKEIKKYFTKTLEESNIKYDQSIQDYLHGDFDFFSNKSIRNDFTENTSIKLEEVSIKEQCVFFDYTKNVTNGEMIPFYNLLKKYKNDAFRTFLSIEQGGKEMGDKILTLGEKLSEESAKILFAKYSEYIDAVNNVEGVVNKEYKLPPSPELINKTKESLLIRGRDLLLSQNQKLSDGEFSEEKFTKSLEDTKVGVDLFKNMFKIAKENNPDTSFEDFAGLVPDHVTSRDQIEDEDILVIDKTIDKNYPNEELRKAVKESFHKALESNKTVLNLLRRGRDIIALDRIDQKEDGTLYFGSFNVDPDYCSSKIGAAFFEATVVPLMKEKIVRADCSSLQPIASYYIESGFIANTLYDYKGEPSFSLESIPDKKFISKDLSRSRIIDLSIINENSDRLIIKSASSQKEITENKIPEGYCLSRYFFDKNKNKWFTVLEKTN